MASTPVLPKLVGERVKRREDPRLVQGRATYVDDIKVAGKSGIDEVAVSALTGKVIAFSHETPADEKREAAADARAAKAAKVKRP